MDWKKLFHSAGISFLIFAALACIGALFFLLVKAVSTTTYFIIVAVLFFLWLTYTVYKS